MDMGSTGVKFSGGKIVPFGSPGRDYFSESMAEAQTQGHIRNMEC